MIGGAARLEGSGLARRGPVHIPSSDPPPLDVDGQTLGDIECELALKAEGARRGAGMKVNVDIPRLHVTLPLSSTNEVQELGEADKIHVGYFRKPRQFVLFPKTRKISIPRRAPSAFPASEETTVAVHLGDNIEIRKGTTLRVLLTETRWSTSPRRRRVSG